MLDQEFRTYMHHASERIVNTQTLDCWSRMGTLPRTLVPWCGRCEVQRTDSHLPVVDAVGGRAPSDNHHCVTAGAARAGLSHHLLGIRIPEVIKILVCRYGRSYRAILRDLVLNVRNTAGNQDQGLEACACTRSTRGVSRATEARISFGWRCTLQARSQGS